MRSHHDALMYDVIMRTTIDLPDDLHRQAMSIARDTSRTLSETVADLLRRALGHGQTQDMFRSSVTGLPVIRLGTPVTTDDVRALEDPEQ
jgi:Arc/MetJ family transcription regulator